jgi:hypothetical protein
MTSIVSPMAVKNPTMDARVAGALRTVARANNIVKSTSGTSCVLAAAAMGFVGMSDVSHEPSVCVPLAANCPAASTAPAGSGEAAQRATPGEVREQVVGTRRQQQIDDHAAPRCHAQRHQQGRVGNEVRRDHRDAEARAVGGGQ